MDEIAFDNTNKVRGYVGEIYSARQFLDGVVDGIIGFAGQGESSANTPTPFALMAEAKLFENVFSLCLSHKGGQLYLGEIDLEGVTWTLRKAKSDFYAITIKDFLVGNISIGITDPSVYNDGDAIVDSGTSDCCLPRPALDALRPLLRLLLRSLSQGRLQLRIKKGLAHNNL